MDLVDEKLDEYKGEAGYTTVDLTYAYGQVPLHSQTARHSIVQSVTGESTGTYSLVTIVTQGTRKEIEEKTRNCGNNQRGKHPVKINTV